MIIDPPRPTWLDDLEGDGVAVVPGAIPLSDVKAFERSAYDWLGTFSPKFDRADKRTWTKEIVPSGWRVGMFSDWGVQHEAFVWRTRRCVWTAVRRAQGPWAARGASSARAPRIPLTPANQASSPPSPRHGVSPLTTWSQAMTGSTSPSRSASTGGLTCGPRLRGHVSLLHPVI